MSPFTSLVVLAFVVSIGLFILGAGLANAAAKKRPRPPMNAVAASHPQTARTPHENCTVPFCPETVVVHIGAGSDRWPFCLTHGMPYLTDQEAAS
jgi:hypothetical protein